MGDLVNLMGALRLYPEDALQVGELGPERTGDVSEPPIDTCEVKDACESDKHKKAVGDRRDRECLRESHGCQFSPSAVRSVGLIRVILLQQAGDDKQVCERNPRCFLETELWRGIVEQM